MKRCRADCSRFCGPYNPMVPQRTISTYLMPVSAFATPPISQARGVHLGSAIGARISGDTSPDPIIHCTSRWENFGSRLLGAREVGSVARVVRGSRLGADGSRSR